MDGLPVVDYASLARRILLWLKSNVDAHISNLSHDDLFREKSQVRPSGTQPAFADGANVREMHLQQRFFLTLEVN